MGGQTAVLEEDELDDDDDAADAEMEEQFGSMFTLKQKQKGGKDKDKSGDGKKGKDGKDKKKKKNKSKWKDKEIPIVIEQKNINLDDQGYIRLSNDELQNQLRQKELEVEAKMKALLNQNLQNADAERIEKENKERELQKKATRLIEKFKGYVWRLALPGLFRRGLENEASLRRRVIIKSYSESFPAMTDSLNNTCKNICVKGLKDVGRCLIIVLDD